MDNRVIRRRRNLPAELKVEIVDCLPVENAVHFLANVPNRLIIHHCAPRIRRILKMIEQIVIGYARTLSTPDYDVRIFLQDGHNYAPETDIFLRYGYPYCNSFFICRDPSDGFVGYPANFFDDLIKHYYETKVPAKAVCKVNIHLSLTNPAPWPSVLIQPQAGKMKLEERKVRNVEKCIRYILRNKHNPDIAFELSILFQRGAICYQQMTCFNMWRVPK